MHKEGVLLLLYDLSMVTSVDIKNYNKFRKNLIGCGFSIIQESVYYRYLRNMSLSNYVISNILVKTPKAANIKFIKMTLKQFERMNKYSTKKIDLSYSRDNVIML